MTFFSDAAAADSAAQPSERGIAPERRDRRRDGRAVVFVVDGNRAVIRGVSPRPLGPDRVTVSGGVAPGEMVVVEAPAGLMDKARVRIK